MLAIYDGRFVPPFLRNRWVLIGLALAVLAVAGAAVAAYEIHVRSRATSPIPTSSSRRRAPATTATTPPPTTASKKKKPKSPQTVNWPRYGYTVGHTRVFEPPHVRWTAHGARTGSTRSARSPSSAR